jgi:ribonuclease T2
LLRFAFALVLILCLWLPCPATALAVTGNQQIASSVAASREPEYLLALSWQPSFCETKPSKQECQTQTSRRFDATHLVLHGLWPQPQANIYCGVPQRIIQLDQNKQWANLPPINLSAPTRRALAEKMPGLMSNLHLHEWYKHGTCYSHSPEEYFQESIALLDQVNNSSVQDLLERNIGRFLEARTIRSEFDRAFSQGAGARVQVQCERDIDQDRNNMVVELQLNLKGVIQPTTPMKGLLLAGRNVPLGCSRGEIDPAGVNQ